MRLLIVLGLLAACVACREEETPVIVRVLRDASSPFADRLTRADLQFSTTQPHLRSGKGVMTATYVGKSFEGKTFREELARLDVLKPQLIILNAETDLPDGPIRDELKYPKSVCGGHPAFITDWVSSEEHEAAAMYVDFLVAHCEGEPVR